MSRINHCIGGQGHQLFADALMDLLEAATGKIGPADRSFEQNVAADHPPIAEDADRSGTVSRSVEDLKDRARPTIEGSFLDKEIGLRRSEGGEEGGEVQHRIGEAIRVFLVDANRDGQMLLGEFEGSDMVGMPMSDQDRLDIGPLFRDPSFDLFAISARVHEKRLPGFGVDHQIAV